MPGTYLGTLENGLNVLRELRDGPLTATEIGERLQLARPTTYRLLRTLEKLRFVDRDRTRSLYQLGLAAWEVGTRALPHPEVRTIAADLVRELASTCGETALLAVLDAGEVVYVAKGDGTNPIRSYAELGSRAPAYCVATGKVMLAGLRAEDRELILRLPLRALTPATIVDPERLRAELAAVAASGVARNHGELREGVGGVAVPVKLDDGQVVAALGFSGPASRLAEADDRLVLPLREAAGAIGRALGSGQFQTNGGRSAARSS